MSNCLTKILIMSLEKLKHLPTKKNRFPVREQAMNHLAWKWHLTGNCWVTKCHFQIKSGQNIIQFLNFRSLLSEKIYAHNSFVGGWLTCNSILLFKIWLLELSVFGIVCKIMFYQLLRSFCSYYPHASEASREVANLCERKTHIPCQELMALSVCGKHTGDIWYVICFRNWFKLW